MSPREPAGSPETAPSLYHGPLLPGLDGKHGYKQIPDKRYLENKCLTMDLKHPLAT